MAVLAQYQIITVLGHYILVIYMALMLAFVSKYSIINALVDAGSDGCPWTSGQQWSDYTDSPIGHHCDPWS
jgi:hypothetical protein